MPEVYRNLNRNDWSIREGGLVVAHRDAVLVAEPRFVVQPAGRQRVLRERRKNVHAFVRGRVVEQVSMPELLDLMASSPDWHRATYNPYLADHFQDWMGRRLDDADWAMLTRDGRLLYVSR